jgi:hypothetical protein
LAVGVRTLSEFDSLAGLLFDTYRFATAFFTRWTDAMVAIGRPGVETVEAVFLEAVDPVEPRKQVTRLRGALVVSGEVVYPCDAGYRRLLVDGASDEPPLCAVFGDD